MNALQWLATSIILIGVGYCLYVLHVTKVSEAFAAGVKFGKAVGNLSQDQIDNAVRSIGLDPKRLPTKDGEWR